MSKGKLFDEIIDEDIESDQLDDSDQQESEEDLAGQLVRDFSKVVLFASDWTAETILHQLKRGNILLNPKFQRRDAWTKPRKSKFIESLIIGLPIPQIVLAEQKGQRGKYIVIDGKQRLLSLMQFAAREGDAFEPLKLEGLDIRKELNGLTMEDFEKRIGEFNDDLTAFQNQTVRTVVIRNWPSEDFLYLIFLRLNTESVKLSPQELRQALHPGAFVDFAESFTRNSDAMKKLLNSTAPDFRMRDVEIMIRFFGFRYFINAYKGNMKQFLDYTCEVLNEKWQTDEVSILESANLFDSAISLTFKVFGNNAFRKWNGKRFEGRTNRAVADIMLFYFSDSCFTETIINNSVEINQKFKHLCEHDDDFRSSLERTTKSLQSTFIRLSKWGNALNEVGIAVKIPNLIENRLEMGD
jgi:hypothetical protein